jgi:hypothetical protein
MASADMTQMDRFDADGVRKMLTDAIYFFADKPDHGLHEVVHGSKVS